MPKKRFSAEQIIVVLRQIEVLMSQGKTPAVACREACVSQQSCATNASTRRSSTASRKLGSSSNNGVINTTPYAPTLPLDIDRPRPRHPQANQSTWIAMPQSSNLCPLGPKYPSGQDNGPASGPIGLKQCVAFLSTANSACGSLATFTSRTILPVSSTMQTLLSLNH